MFCALPCALIAFCVPFFVCRHKLPVFIAAEAFALRMLLPQQQGNTATQATRCAFSYTLCFCVFALLALSRQSEPPPFGTVCA
jgi:hypothetical protein